MRIVFIGPPGAGKGTQAEAVCQHFGILHLSTGAVFRAAIRADTEVGQLAKSYLRDGQLVPDEIVIRVVRDRIAKPDCAAGCLFDGFPRTKPQAEALDRLLEEAGMPIDVVLEIEVDADELTRRLCGRGREDDSPEILHQRFLVYQEQMAPVLDYYRSRGLLRSIDGKGRLEEVTKRVLDVVNSLETEAP